MANVEKTFNTRQYQFTLRTYSGKKVSVTAFGMDRITGPVTKLNTSALAKLFPTYDLESLQRKSNRVDILLGCYYFGLLPKYEEAKCGENLSVTRGEFGVCLQGAHPDLVEQTEYDSNLVETIHNSAMKHTMYIFTLGQNVSQIVFPQWRFFYNSEKQIISEIRQML